jgi:hypothetical protein
MSPTSRISVAPDFPLLHLYRHILREVSYLPPAFSGSISRLVQSSFHRNAKSDNHIKKRTARARATLRTLRAANHGHRASMESLMNKGFARTGKRRRELISQLLVSQGPSDSKALSALLEKQTTDDTSPRESKASSSGADIAASSKKPVKHAFLDRWDREKLLRLLKSQQRQQKDSDSHLDWHNKALKGMNERTDVPVKTIWGKPPSERLVRTKTALWWKRTIGKLLPPLGKGEWDLLRQLSEGAQETSEWQIPPRRTPARPILGSELKSDENAEWKWQEYARHPVAFIETPQSVREQQVDGSSEKTPYLGRARKQQITERWFRRAYNRIWRTTPHVVQNPNTLKEDIHWGSPITRPIVASGRQLEIFEGIEESSCEVQQKPRRGSKQA